MIIYSNLETFRLFSLVPGYAAWTCSPTWKFNWYRRYFFEFGAISLNHFPAPGSKQDASTRPPTHACFKTVPGSGIARCNGALSRPLVKGQGKGHTEEVDRKQEGEERANRRVPS